MSGHGSGPGRRRRAVWVAAALVATSWLTACGGSDDAAVSVDEPATEAVVPTGAVEDLATGATVELASLLPADRPLLVWFWAPH